MTAERVLTTALCPLWVACAATFITIAGVQCLIEKAARR